MLSTNMSDQTDKSLAFRLVKYLLMVMYVFDILGSIMFLCAGCLQLYNNETAVQLFREEVKDFETSYNKDQAKYMAYGLIVSSLLLIVIVIYFMYAAYVESLRQNAVIAVIEMFFTFIYVLFFSTTFKDRFFSVWLLGVMCAYVYLLDKKRRSRMISRSEGAQDLDVENNLDINAI